MAVYAVAQGLVKNRGLLDEYVEQAVRSIGAAGGKIIGFDETPDVIEGTVTNPRTVIIKFDSKAAFEEWYRSPGYQAIIQKRFDSAPGTLVVVDGIRR